MQEKIVAELRLTVEKEVVARYEAVRVQEEEVRTVQYVHCCV